MDIIETEENLKGRQCPITNEIEKLAASIISQMGSGTPPSLAVKTLATAESCTGGQMASALTAVAGSSKIFGGGVVAYTEAAKCKLLGVPASLMTSHGVVSAEVAKAMALGAVKTLGTTFALSSTGVAGPSGGSLETPVGTVFIGLAGPNILVSRPFLFAGSRAEITTQAVRAAFELLIQNLN